MPFYEYQCKSCGHSLEAMQKVNDSPLKKCPDCGKSQLTRLMSAPVFRLKGGGWYETDFKGDQDKKRNLADRPEADTAQDDKKGPGDAKAGDAKGAESTARDDKPAEKSLEKAADKAPSKTESAPAKTSGNGISRRAARPAKPAAHRSVKKPAKKAAARAKRR